MILKRKINGHVYGHSSIECTVNGVIFPAIQEITYSHQLEPGHIFAKGKKAARTRGRYAPEDATVKLYKADYDHLRASLSPDYMEKSFVIVVSYGEQGEPLITDTLKGCRIKMAETTSSQDNTDAVMTTVTLDVMEILENSASAVGGALAGVVGAAISNVVANILP